MAASRESVAELRQVTVEYPGVRALDEVSVGIAPGEVHVLVGENGAGKSTLVKLLTGAAEPTTGGVALDGEAVRFRSPQDALTKGVSAVYQHFSLVPEMTVAQNVLLGRWPGKHWRIDHGEAARRTREVLGLMDLELDPQERVSNLPLGLRQQIEIGKALAWSPRLLVMDEPTSGLQSEDVAALLAVVARLRERGVSILYISHRLEEVFSIGDRITVLRNGRLVETRPTSEFTHGTLIEAMTGTQVDETERVRVEGGKTVDPSDRPVLELRGVSARGIDDDRWLLKDIDLTVAAGEVVGVAGILDSGKDEIGEIAFGLRSIDEGSMYFDGDPFVPRSPFEAINAGVGFLSADRHKAGIVPGMSVRANAMLAGFRKLGRPWLLGHRRERAHTAQLIADLSIRTPDMESHIRNLSGGNQQKTLIGRWLATGAKLLILDEPTRGVDVGARREIFALLRQEAGAGKAVLVLSQEFPELVQVCDRIVVVAHGEIVGELAGDTASSRTILEMATRQGGAAA